MVEHARKIGIWIWAVIFSPYLGPFLSSLIAEYSDWRTSVWTLFGLFGLAVVLVVLFADETIYDRKHAKEQPPRPEGFLRDRFESLVGIRGWKATHRPSGWKEFGALWHIMTRPYFLLVLCMHPSGEKANSSLPTPHIHVVDRSKRVPPAVCLPSASHRIWLLQLDNRSAVHWTHACHGHWGNVRPLFQ
jgi:MFS family permease